MATKVIMRHKDTGLLKNGFFGFSWTTFFFFAFPALFRSDFLTFLGVLGITIVVGALTFGFGLILVGPIWAFMYNKYYTRKLFENGYAFHDTDALNAKAAAAVGIALPRA